VSFRISDEKVQEIRERADIVQIVGERVALKKAGVRYVGLCPFHQEKTPSFSVHPGMGIFHCFGCGVGGDVFTFVMKLEGRPFVDVATDLAERVGVQIPRRELTAREIQAAQAAKDERAEMLRLNEMAASFYHGLLLQDPAARHAREYLAERRISDDMVRRFRLGFAPPAWDVMVGFFRRNKVDLPLVCKLGLVQEKERGGHYDRFRNRLLFPILGPAGEVLGFGGRQLAEADGAKYLNSPESPVFHKGRCLYGLHLAARAVRGTGALLVVEGYFDLITLVQSGIENVVATLGTALTEDHLSLLRRYAREVLVLFDGDEAGVRAAQKSAELLLGGGLAARVVELPAGDDPDTFVLREGPEAFRGRVAAAKPIVEFAIEAASARAERSPAGKARCVESLRPIFASVSNPVERSLYVAKLSDRLAVPERALEEGLRGGSSAAIASREAARTATDARTVLGTPELRLAGIVLAHPALAAEAAAALDDTGETAISALIRRVATVYETEGRVDSAAVLAEVADAQLRSRVVARAFEETEGPEGLNIAARALRDILRSLRERKLRAEAALLQRRLSEAAAQGNQTLVHELAAQRMELEKKIRGLFVA
jgi:DNA primase